MEIGRTLINRFMVASSSGLSGLWWVEKLYNIFNKIDAMEVRGNIVFMANVRYFRMEQGCPAEALSILMSD
jgi:hypothetical protein